MSKVVPPWEKKGGALAQAGADLLHEKGKPGRPRRPMRMEVVTDEPEVDWRELENLSQMQVDKYDRFAQEYIQDFNIKRATIRMGVNPKTAAVIGNNMFWSNYVQRRILHLLKTIEEECLVERTQVIAGLLQEANDRSPGSSQAARIVAWREIGKIMGMYVIKTEVDHRNLPPTINLIANQPKQPDAEKD